MNDVIKHIIPNYLSYKDLLSLSMADRKLNDILQQAVKERRELLRNELYNLFPSRIINMVKMSNLLKANKVEWNPRWMGGTDYIDSVEVTDLDTTFTYGEDNYHRSFIFVRMRNHKTNRDFVLVIFQRYTDAGTYVAIDPINGIDLKIKGGNVAIDESFQKILTGLIAEKYEDHKLL